MVGRFLWRWILLTAPNPFCGAAPGGFHWLALSGKTVAGFFYVRPRRNVWGNSKGASDRPALHASTYKSLTFLGSACKPIALSVEIPRGSLGSTAALELPGAVSLPAFSRAKRGISPASSHHGLLGFLTRFIRQHRNLCLLHGRKTPNHLAATGNVPNC